MTPILLESIPAQLRACPQWVSWRMEPRPGQEKPTKVPYNARTGSKASSVSSDTWSAFEAAVAALNAPGNYYTGLGFVFSDNDSFAGMDIDDCRNPNTGEIEDWAKPYIQCLNSYTEVSPSGTGVKIWVMAQKRGTGSRKAPHFEMYDQGRFFAMTGQHLKGTPLTVEARDTEYNTIHSELFPTAAGNTPKQKHEFNVLMSDADLIQKASEATNGIHFKKLWDGDYSAYGSQSEADIALCGKLAYWAQADAGRVDSLFRQSRLMRNKWDERHHNSGRTYGEATVEKACYNANCYDPGRAKQPLQGGNAVTEEAHEWEPPIPFTARSLPPFPVDALPEVLAEYVREVAAVKQVPVDLAAMMGLAVTAAAGAGRCKVQIGGGDYTEPLNLYIASFMEPGSRKSSTLEAMAFPMRDAEKEKIKELEPKINAARERRAIHEKRLDFKRNLAAKAKGDDEYRVAMNKIDETNEELPPIPVQPCYLTEDVTPERMAGLLAEQGGVMAILSAEGGLFGMLAGRYSPNTNIDIFLKGHSGEDYRVDRIGRPSEMIPKATVTLGLAVQPDILRSLAQSQEFRGRGLLARFLFSVPDSLVGKRLSQKDRSIDPQAKRRYGQAIRSILDLPTLATEDNSGERYPLLLTGEAWDLWAAEYDRVEKRQASGEDLAGIQDWASKLHGAAARIAGGFHLFQEAVNGSPWGRPISVETVASAWQVCHYLIAHALAVFGQLGADPDQAQARKLLDWLEQRGWLKHREVSEQALDGDQFTLYECFRSHQGVGKPNALRPALNILCERHYIRLEEGVKNPNGGRPKSHTFRLNPAILG